MRQPKGANGYRQACKWLRGVDLNHRPLGYEPNELPDCSTPHFDHTEIERSGQTNELLCRSKLRVCAEDAHECSSSVIAMAFGSCECVVRSTLLLMSNSVKAAGGSRREGNCGTSSERDEK